MADFTWTDLEVRRALGLREEAARDDLEYAGVSTDSRATGEGDLYVALVGDRFDGHDFVADALAAGARGAVVSKPCAGADAGVLYPVEDTLVALGALASHRRARLPARVIGITGSAGKTSTKDLTAAAVGDALRLHRTEGNLNNRVGLPLTLLRAPVDAEVVVAEMGTNEPGEIAALVGIGRPDASVLTNVGESHLEKLGSVEGVMSEKLAIFRGLREDGFALVGDEPPELVERARALRPDVRVAGWSERADEDLRPGDPRVDDRGRWSFDWRGHRVDLRVPGRPAVQNALLALALAEWLGVDPARAAEGIHTLGPGAMRGEEREVGGLTLLMDCYNANPQSVRAALDLLEGRSGARRVAVLGTMLELGDRSEALHREILDDALSRSLDLVVATGGFAAAAATAERPERPELIAAREPKAGYGLLKPKLRGDELVLLKGSRGVALEKLVPLFEADFGAEPPGGDD